MFFTSWFEGNITQFAGAHLDQVHWTPGFHRNRLEIATYNRSSKHRFMSFTKQTLAEHHGSQSTLSLEPVGTWVPAPWQRGSRASRSLSFHTFTCNMEAQKHNLWITDFVRIKWGTCEVLRDVCADLPPGKCSVHLNFTHTIPQNSTANADACFASLHTGTETQGSRVGELLKVTQKGGSRLLQAELRGSQTLTGLVAELNYMKQFLKILRGMF